MASYQQSTYSLLIQAPPEQIYASLTDWALRLKWRPGMGISWEGGGGAFVGQKVCFRVKSPFFSYLFSFRITGLEPPRRIYMEYGGKPLKGRAAVEITPEDGGCRVGFHWMKVEPVGFLARVYFALGLGARSHRRRTLETLRMLKTYLEQTAKTNS